MKFTIAFDDGGMHTSTSFIAPSRLPKPGDVYRVVAVIPGSSGIVYYPGDRLTIVGRTDRKCQFFSSSLGNLLVECRRSTSVWATIEMHIANGHLTLVNY